MKKRRFTCLLRAAAFAAFASTGCIAAHASPASPAATAPILYTHVTYQPNGVMKSATLFRVNPTNGAITKLTPQIDEVFYLGGSWSPGGTRIVYEHATDPSPYYTQTYGKSQIYTIDGRGGSKLLLTPGADLTQQPVWGPGSTIAFIDVTSGCLSVVRYDGRGLRPLFCPPLPHAEMTTWADPKWSPDGKNIYLQVGQWRKDGLELNLYSFVYRVNAATGVPMLLVSDINAKPQALSPDGTHGVYTDSDSMWLVDFSTGTKTWVTRPGLPYHGAYYGASYSSDGSQIAFSHIYAGNFGIYVMRPDGTDVRLITSEPDVSADQKMQVNESVVGWSADGSRILVNRTCWHLEHGEYVPYPSLRLVDVATHAVTNLPNVKGQAGGTAWYQPH